MTINQCITGKNKTRSYSGDYMERGLEGQQIVINFLKTNPKILGVNDWSNLELVQDADIDMAIKTKSGHVILAEIKSDIHLGKTGNVLFEVLRINHTCNPEFSVGLGWSARTPAKFIFFYAPAVNKIYRFTSISMRKALQRYTQYARKGTKIDFVETDNIKSTINILIPIRFFNNEFESYQIKEIQNSHEIDFD